MKILYYDCFAGISGDMNLGALVDIGVPFEYLCEQLKKLNVENLELRSAKKDKMGIFGTKIDVIYKEEHVHRHMKDIKDILDNSDLSKSIVDRAMKMFDYVGQAEAKVHNKSIEEIHFHEVGAIDSIADIVGAAVCLDYLQIDEIWCSSVQLGGGFVKCAHGVIPVPAPAVCEIVKGIPVKSGLVQYETTTPTGAAILKANVNRFIDNPQLEIMSVGYGLGTRDMEIPNVLRVFTAEVREENEDYIDITREILIQCNIDDMSGERYEIVFQELLNAGAKDVFLENIIMKKSRPGVKLSVLCHESIKKEIIDIILRKTTSIGVRIIPVEKWAMKREFEKVETPWGDVRVKKSYYSKDQFKFKGEFSDIKEVVNKHNISFEEVERFIKNKIRE